MKKHAHKTKNEQIEYVQSIFYDIRNNVDMIKQFGSGYN